MFRHYMVWLTGQCTYACNTNDKLELSLVEKLFDTMELVALLMVRFFSEFKPIMENPVLDTFSLSFLGSCLTSTLRFLRDVTWHTLRARYAAATSSSLQCMEQLVGSPQG